MTSLRWCSAISVLVNMRHWDWWIWILRREKQSWGVMSARGLRNRVISRDWYQTYAEYLRHPVFLAARAVVMIRARGTCERCESTPATEPHHLRYPPWGTFDVPEHMIAVCHGCHCELEGQGHMKSIAIERLRVGPPFSTLFAIENPVLARITNRMREFGYDQNKPIAVATGNWPEAPIVVDGHTRLKAARAVGFTAAARYRAPIFKPRRGGVVRDPSIPGPPQPRRRGDPAGDCGGRLSAQTRWRSEERKGEIKSATWRF